MLNAYIVPPNSLVVRTDNTPTLNPLAFSAAQLNAAGLPKGLISVQGKTFLGGSEQLPVFIRDSNGNVDILDKPTTEDVMYADFIVSGTAILVSEKQPRDVKGTPYLRKHDNVKRVVIGLLEDGNMFVVYCTATVESLKRMLCAYGVVTALLLASDDVYFSNPRNGVSCGEQPVITLQATYYEELPSPTILIDPAHGGNDPGNCSYTFVEKHLTLAVAREMQKYLIENYYGTFLLTRDDDSLLPLTSKIELAKAVHADFYYECHIGALDGVTRGFECYGYSDASDNVKTLTQKLHELLGNILAAHGITDNGLHMKTLLLMQYLPCPSFIAETLYMDNAHDAYLLEKRETPRLLGVAQGEALAQALGLNKRVRNPWTDTPTPETSFKVRVGQSYRYKLGALELCEKLRQFGFDAYVTRE